MVFSRVSSLRPFFDAIFYYHIRTWRNLLRNYTGFIVYVDWVGTNAFEVDGVVSKVTLSNNCANVSYLRVSGLVFMTHSQRDQMTNVLASEIDLLLSLFHLFLESFEELKYDGDASLNQLF